MPRLAASRRSPQGGGVPVCSPSPAAGSSRKLFILLSAVLCVPGPTSPALPLPPMIPENLASHLSFPCPRDGAAVGLERGPVPGSRGTPGTVISRRRAEGAFGEAEGPGSDQALGFLGQGSGGRRFNRPVSRWWTRLVAGRKVLFVSSGACTSRLLGAPSERDNNSDEY